MDTLKQIVASKTSAKGLGSRVIEEYIYFAQPARISGDDLIVKVTKFESLADPSYNYYANIANTYNIPGFGEQIYIIITDTLIETTEITASIIYDIAIGLFGVGINEPVDFDTVTDLFFGEAYSISTARPAPYKVYLQLDEGNTYMLIVYNLNVPVRAYNITVGKTLIDSFGSNELAHYPVFANSRLPLWQK